MEFNFEKLQVWQQSRLLVKDVYMLLRKFPKEEQFALADQIRRSIISVPSNIAEGKGRLSTKELVHHVSIAYGSLMECYCQLTLAMDLGYITSEELESIRGKFSLPSPFPRTHSPSTSAHSYPPIHPTPHYLSLPDGYSNL